MATSNTPDARSLPEYHINAVFEGGGAKGVAYVGALHALEDLRVRIVGVAGASAGAITATLVAAGLSAASMEAELPKGLACFSRQMPQRDLGFWQHLAGVRVYWRLLSNLRTQGRLLEVTEFEAWLSGLIGRALGGRDGSAVTFSDLHSATGVDLYVVGANVSAREQVVFNHRTTPQCQVVPAVLASSGIPGALPSGKLAITENRPVAPRRTHTIVDGGVWANYPDFVFSDLSFREGRNLPRPTAPLVGFVLEETNIPVSELDADTDLTETELEYLNARFVGPSHSLPRTEAVLQDEHPSARRRRLAPLLWCFCLLALGLGIAGPGISAAFRRPLILGGIFSVSALFFVLGHLLPPHRIEGGSGIDGGWPRNRATRFFRSALTVLHPLPVILSLIFVFFLMVMTIAQDAGVTAVPAGLAGVLDRFFPGLFFALIIYVIWYLAILVVLATLLFNTLRRTLEDWAWGVMRTYVVGPGAPKWRGLSEDEHVIRLPIPQEVSTLSFDVGSMTFSGTEDGSESVLAKLIQTSRRRTFERMRTIIDGSS